MRRAGVCWLGRGAIQRERVPEGRWLFRRDLDLAGRDRLFQAEKLVPLLRQVKVVDSGAEKTAAAI